MEFPTIDEFAKNVAEKALDEFIYEGKTIREWVEIIAKQQHCEDAISRAEVINEIDRYIDKAQSTGTRDDFISFQELVVKQLPPVTPQLKTGHWIGEENLDGSIWYMCDNCKEFEFVNYYDYCPNCGAKMEVEK